MPKTLMERMDADVWAGFIAGFSLRYPDDNPHQEEPTKLNWEVGRRWGWDLRKLTSNSKPEHIIEVDR